MSAQLADPSAWSGRMVPLRDPSGRTKCFVSHAKVNFPFGLDADIGRKSSDEQGVEAQVFGTFLTYALES